MAEINPLGVIHDLSDTLHFGKASVIRNYVESLAEKELEYASDDFHRLGMNRPSLQ